MKEHEFQHEVLKRLGHMEAEIRGLGAELKGLKQNLSERCADRLKSINLLWDKREETKRRLEFLENAEHRRRGGVAVMASLWAGAGVLGALFSKLLPFTDGK